MQSRRLLVLVGSLLAVSCGFFVARAQSTMPFAITATNVTMPTNGGFGISQYTDSGIPAAGTLTISCAYSGPTTVAKIPTCTYGPILALPVPTGTQMGDVYFYPYGTILPVGARGAPLPSGHLPAAALALAGALMLGFGFRRRARRWLALVLLAAGTLAGVGGISGCISHNPMTPGTYQYTISAVYAPSPQTPLEEQVTTNIEVTVP
jgi:hypothetical protein